MFNNALYSIGIGIGDLVV